MHGVYRVNIENALRWEELSFVIRKKAVYVAAARPHQCTILHAWNAEVDSSFISIQDYLTDRSLSVTVLCRYVALVPVDQGRV